MRRSFILPAASIVLIELVAAGYALLDNSSFATAADATVPSETALDKSSRNETDRKMEDEIARLIESLGSDQYAMRRHAQLELERIGVPALDQLQQAILNPDPQIATAAKYMIRSSYIRWTGREDPLNVRKLLENYGSGDVVFRSERIDRLRELSNRQGVPALLRIARYETSVDLSKRAALAVMVSTSNNTKSQTSDDLKRNSELWLSIFESTSKTKGTACNWLKELSKKNRDQAPWDPRWWQNAIDHEMALLESKSGDTSREIVSELTRWVAEQLSEDNQRDSALAVARNLLRIPYSLRERSKFSEDLYNWALDKKLPEIVIDHSGKILVEIENSGGGRQANKAANPPAILQPFADRASAPFTVKIRYLRAEALRQQKDEASANRESLTAFNRDGSAGEDGLYQRWFYGEFLRNRKQYDWAERELREACKYSIERQQDEVKYCYDLSTFLADGADFAGAEEALRPLIKRFEASPNFARETDNDSPPQAIFLPDDQAVLLTQRLRALWLYFRAKAMIDKKEIDAAWNDLREALSCDPENVDIIISMMEITSDLKPTTAEKNLPKTASATEPEDPKRAEAKKAFATVVLAFRETLPRLEKGMRMSTPTELATYQKQYSIALNTYAWLLASTDHDLAYSLECSELACRLQPKNAAYLDTLARCHFKNGEIETAIAIQQQAVDAEPSTRELQRNLDAFKAAKK